MTAWLLRRYPGTGQVHDQVSLNRNGWHDPLGPGGPNPWAKIVSKGECLIAIMPNFLAGQAGDELIGSGGAGPVGRARFQRRLQASSCLRGRSQPGMPDVPLSTASGGGTVLAGACARRCGRDLGGGGTAGARDAIRAAATPWSPAGPLASLLANHDIIFSHHAEGAGQMAYDCADAGPTVSCRVHLH